MSQPYLPAQAAAFSGPGKQALAIWCPGWEDPLLALLTRRPTAYEAGWQFAPAERAHLLTIAYDGADPITIGLIDGTHNAILAALAKGSALVLSPYRLYREFENQEVALFDPERSLVLPELPPL